MGRCIPVDQAKQPVEHVRVLVHQTRSEGRRSPSSSLSLSPRSLAARSSTPPAACTTPPERSSGSCGLWAPSSPSQPCSRSRSSCRGCAVARRGKRPTTDSSTSATYGHRSVEDIERRLRALDHDEELSQLARQLKATSVIAWRKHAHLQVAMLSLLIAGTLFGIARLAL
jgi:hypothetical protein